MYVLVCAVKKKDVFRPTLNHLLKSNELTTALETLRSIVNEMCMLRIVLVCAVKNNVF